MYGICHRKYCQERPNESPSLCFASSNEWMRDVTPLCCYVQNQELEEQNKTRRIFELHCITWKSWHKIVFFHRCTSFRVCSNIKDVREMNTKAYTMNTSNHPKNWRRSRGRKRIRSGRPVVLFNQLHSHDECDRMSCLWKERF